MRMLSVMFLCCIASASCLAQEAETPKTLARFLKPGAHVGIRDFDATDGINVTIYSNSDYEIALDARRLDIDTLAAKHQKVAQTRDRTLEKFTASLESKRDDLPAGTEFGKPIVSLAVDGREGLYTVTHVGDDYILVSQEDAQTKRRVFSTRFTSTIGWHDDLRFNTSVGHVAAQRTE